MRQMFFAVAGQCLGATKRWTQFDKEPFEGGVRDKTKGAERLWSFYKI